MPRRKRRGLRRENRCKRFHDAEPLPSRRCELRERRCKRFHVVEPLPSRLCELRERRCERFHVVEPLPSPGCEHRERRCKRFHVVEPLPSRLCELQERRSQDREPRSQRGGRAARGSTSSNLLQRLSRSTSGRPPWRASVSPRRERHTTSSETLCLQSETPSFVTVRYRKKYTAPRTSPSSVTSARTVRGPESHASSPFEYCQS